MDLEKIRNEVGAEIKKLQRVFEALGGITVRAIQAKPRRKLSKAARAKIAEAQRARWAKVRAKAPKRKYKKGTHWTQKPENKAKPRLVQKARKAA